MTKFVRLATEASVTAASYGKNRNRAVRTAVHSDEVYLIIRPILEFSPKSFSPLLSSLASKKVKSVAAVWPLFLHCILKHKQIS